MKKNILFIVFSFLFSLQAFAQGQMGYFLFTSNKGMVQIIDKDKKNPRIIQKNAKKNPVHFGDFIRTNSKTSLKLFLEDGQRVIDIYPKTIYKVNPPKNNKSIFNLLLGKALFAIKKIAGKEFEVKTKFSTVGVKGTTYVVGLSPCENQRGTPCDSYVMVVEGLVAFTPTANIEGTVLIGPGQYSEIDEGGQASEPKELSSEEQTEVIEEGKLEEEQSQDSDGNQEGADSQGGQQEESVVEEETVEEEEKPTENASDIEEIVQDASEKIEEVQKEIQEDAQNEEYLDIILELNF